MDGARFERFVLPSLAIRCSNINREWYIPRARPCMLDERRRSRVVRRLRLCLMNWLPLLRGRPLNALRSLAASKGVVAGGGRSENVAKAKGY